MPTADLGCVLNECTDSETERLEGVGFHMIRISRHFARPAAERSADHIMIARLQMGHMVLAWCSAFVYAVVNCCFGSTWVIQRILAVAHGLFKKPNSRTATAEVAKLSTAWCKVSLDLCCDLLDIGLLNTHAAAGTGCKPCCIAVQQPGNHPSQLHCPRSDTSVI